jgi:hypothetical protein
MAVAKSIDRMHVLQVHRVLLTIAQIEGDRDTYNYCPQVSRKFECACRNRKTRDPECKLSSTDCEALFFHPDLTWECGRSISRCILWNVNASRSRRRAQWRFVYFSIGVISLYLLQQNTWHFRSSLLAQDACLPIQQRSRYIDAEYICNVFSWA